MVKVIRLSRYVFEKGHIQHNVTLSVSGLFEDEAKLANERINIMHILLDSLFPNTIKIVSLSISGRPVTDEARALKELEFSKRSYAYSVGSEITLDQLKDLMLYCYSNGLELELDVLDIKNQHVTAIVNKELFGYHYIYGAPETFTEEYLKTIKKKLKDCVFEGSFKKTL